MARNYGERLVTRSRVVMVGGILSVGLIAAFGINQWLYNRHVEQKAVDAWIVSGPPCQALTLAQFQILKLENPIPFGFQGLKGERAHGDVDCLDTSSDISGPGTVCKFTAPFALHLATAKGDLYFEPGVGKPATVAVSGGKITCVVGTKEDE